MNSRITLVTCKDVCMVRLYICSGETGEVPSYIFILGDSEALHRESKSQGSLVKHLNFNLNAFSSLHTALFSNDRMAQVLKYNL